MLVSGTLKLNLKERIREVGSRTGWPALLLCSAAGTVAATLVVLLATQVIQVWLMEPYWRSKATTSAWLAGLLVAATVGFECGRRVVVARMVRRLPGGYRLWFGKDNPLAQACRALDTWNSDSDRRTFMSRIRTMKTAAAAVTGLKERMAFFACPEGADRCAMPPSHREGKDDLLLRLCLGVENAIAEFLPMVTTGDVEPSRHHFDRWMDTRMEIGVEEYELQEWLVDGPAALAPLVSEPAQLALADEIFSNQWGKPDYRKYVLYLGLTFFIGCFALCGATLVLLAIATPLVLADVPVNVVAVAFAMVDAFVMTGTMVYMGSLWGSDVFREALPARKSSLDARVSLAGASNPLERVRVLLGILGNEERARLLCSVASGLRTALRDFENSMTAPVTSAEQTR